MKASAATPDGFTTKTIKLFVKYFPVHVVNLINYSFKYSMVPLSLKYSIVTPIFKKGCKKDLKNYSPVTVLSNFGKILEKAVKEQIMKYLRDITFFYSHQYGFLENCSTADACFQLATYIQSALDNGYYATSLFLDVSKALDSVSHELLLHKLVQAGIEGDAILWFRNYLSERVQVVRFDNILSTPGKVKSGVPQGSILGPLLFLIYINDLAKICLLYTSDAADE